MPMRLELFLASEVVKYLLPADMETAFARVDELDLPAAAVEVNLGEDQACERPLLIRVARLASQPLLARQEQLGREGLGRLAARVEVKLPWFHRAPPP